MEIRCFMLEPLALVERYLRRYSTGTCPRGRLGYHDATAVIGVAPHALDDVESRADVSEPPIDDVRWPRACATCAIPFGEGAPRQANVARLYERSDGGPRTTLRAAPEGAMWRAPWLDKRSLAPDGVPLVVRTPGGDWCIDGAARDGSFWARTGVPPLVTVTPSIILGPYHGWLRDGILVLA